MRAVKIVLVVVLALVLALVALLLSFDPNRFKPQLIELAAERQIALTIDGELGWQLWPRLALTANQVAVAPLNSPDQPVAAIEQFRAALVLAPLFQQQIQIDGISLVGANIQLKVDKNGLGNWQGLGQLAAQAPAPQLVPALASTRLQAHAQKVADSTNATSTGDYKLQLARLQLADSSLSYQDAQGLSLTLSDINARISNLKTDNSPVPVTLTSQFKLVRPQAPTLAGSTDAQFSLRLPASLDQLAVEQLVLPVTLKQQGTEAKLAVSGQARLVLSPMHYSGEIALAPTNMQLLMRALGSPLPAMAGKKALHSVSITGQFKGDGKHAKLEPLEIELDDSHIAGKLAITDFTTLAIDANLSGDHINLDLYLPPAEPQGKAVSGGKKAAGKPGNPAEFPLETLRALKLNLNTGFEQMSIKQLPFEQVKAHASANGGLIKLNSFDARLHKGPLSAKAVFDVRKSEPKLTFSAEGNKLPLEQLLADMDLKPLLSGQGQMEVKGWAKGKSSTELANSLHAKAQLKSQQMLLHQLNLEKSLCELAALAQRKEMPKVNWDDFTKLQTLTSELVYANNRLTVKSMQGGVESMAMGGQGLVDLSAGALDVTFNLTIDEAANALLHCPIANKKWLNRKLPIRCKDSFAKLNLRSCAPDMAAVEDLYRNEVKDKLESELDKHLKNNPEARDLLNNLFGNKKKQ